MPLIIPTLTELKARQAADLADRLGIGPLLPKSVLRAFANQWAGSSFELYGAMQWIARQGIPDTADLEELERWASLFGVQRKSATAASGFVTVLGADLTIVPAGTVLEREDGALYRTLDEELIRFGETVVQVDADEVGAGGNTPAGAPMALQTPIAGVADEGHAVGPDGLVNGADAETDSGLRERLRVEMRTRPGCGSAGDFVRWAREVPGVTRAWAHSPGGAPGTVYVTFAVDDDADGPVPNAAKVIEVTQYLDERRSVTSKLVCFAPGLFPINVRVQHLDPNSAAVRDGVRQSLIDLLRNGPGPAELLRVSHIREAISTTPLERNHILVAPAADLIIPGGSIPVLGDLDFESQVGFKLGLYANGVIV